MLNNNFSVPRWAHWLITTLIVFFSTVEWFLIRRRVVVAVSAGIFILGLAYGYASGSCGVIPPATRLANICAALNSDVGCEWQEIAHLRGDRKSVV